MTWRETVQALAAEHAVAALAFGLAIGWDDDSTLSYAHKVLKEARAAL